MLFFIFLFLEKLVKNSIKPKQIFVNIFQPQVSPVKNLPENLNYQILFNFMKKVKENLFIPIRSLTNQDFSKNADFGFLQKKKNVRWSK